MKQLLKNTIIFFGFIAVLAFAESVYDMSGSFVGPRSMTKGPKATVKINERLQDKRSILKTISINSDTLQIASTDSVYWIELKKNTNYTICADYFKEGVWKGSDFSYQKKDNCILFNSGNFVKSGVLWYITNIGNVSTFNFLVEMKYINLSEKKHLLGYSNKKDRRYNNQQSRYTYLDSVRYEKINKILLVDKYKVTECEFLQSLWDSIPSQTNKNMYDNHNFWIKKKQTTTKDAYCDTHDSAATRIFLYHAFVFANNRSIRDGLKPVYSFKKANNIHASQWFDNGDFSVLNLSFFSAHLDEFNYIHVSIDHDANGYRLPYFNEWTALARSGEGYKNYKNFWNNSEDSVEASKYAWFGEINSDDRYLKMDPQNPSEKNWLKYSCGKWQQNSKPVGVLQPNSYGLYDMLGLVCENTLMSGKSIFSNEISSCKGGFLTSSLDDLNFGNHCDDPFGFVKTFQGLRLVREIK